MGYVIAQYSVRPDGPEVDIEAIKSEVEKLPDVRECRIEDFMFGMKQVIVIFRINDKQSDTGIDELEEKLESIPGVSGIQQMQFGLE